jgi:adenylate cyclase
MVATSRDTVDVSDRVERSRDQVRTGALDVTDNDKALKGEKLCPPRSGASGGACWGGRGRRGGVQRPFAFPIRHTHLEQGLALYDPQKHRALAVLYGHDPGVCCRSVGVVDLWLLGYPDQALRQQHAADTLAQEVAHPPSLAFTRMLAAIAHQLRRETHAAHEQAEALIALATEQGFALFLAIGGILRGGTRTALGQRGEQIGQIRQDLAAAQATGERWGEAELSRLRGSLLLQQTGTPQAEVETWLQRALDAARRQEAKSLELRAAMSLRRLWHQQGKRKEAHDLLAEVYAWLTEGFDPADLQEAKALLEELA